MLVQLPPKALNVPAVAIPILMWAAQPLGTNVIIATALVISLLYARAPEIGDVPATAITSNPMTSEAGPADPQAAGTPAGYQAKAGCLTEA